MTLHVHRQCDRDARAFFNEKIRTDIRALMAERGKAERSPVWFYALLGLMGLCVVALVAKRAMESGKQPAA